MPYDSIAELPEPVKERYSARCQEVFRKAFNAAEGDEETRFKVAHTAAGMCKDAGKAQPLKAGELDVDEMEAWFAGKLPRPLLAIPFGGPIPSADGKGRDLDGEFFDERTDIKADWFEKRPALWHHGTDPLKGGMGDTVIGHATDLRMEEDGWWVDFWFKAGEQRVSRIKTLVQKGAELFGSSGSIAHLIKRDAKSGHIEVWPYWEQTLSTSPQNTKSVVGAKALLDVYDIADIPVMPALRDVLTELDALRDLSSTFGSGEGTAKAELEASDAFARLADVVKAMRALHSTP
jgi:hypothetical protein